MTPVPPATPTPEAMPAPTPQDEAAMRRALELARRAAQQGEVPVGAVVYRTAGGEVLGEGFNRREQDADPTAHAEVLAVRAACRAIGDWRLGECSLAVTLEPCPMCAGAIVNARVGRVVYAADDPKAGAVRTLYALLDDPRLNHRVGEVVPGLLASEAATLLTDFFRALRRPAGPPSAGP